MATNSGKTWTEPEIQQLRELAGTLTAPQISLQIGRSPSGISKQIKKLSLPSFKPAGKPIPKPTSPVARPVRLKAYIEPKDGLRQPSDAAKYRSNGIVYPPAELCPVHKCLVSNWAEHIQRLRGTCSRPAA